MSYSVYLWQQPFLDRFASSPLQAFPLNLALAAACGAASFYLVERPMLRLRNRLVKRQGEVPREGVLSGFSSASELSEPLGEQTGPVGVKRDAEATTALP